MRRCSRKLLALAHYGVYKSGCPQFFFVLLAMFHERWVQVFEFGVVNCWKQMVEVVVAETGNRFKVFAGIVDSFYHCVQLVNPPIYVLSSEKYERSYDLNCR